MQADKRQDGNFHNNIDTGLDSTRFSFFFASHWHTKTWLHNTAQAVERTRRKEEPAHRGSRPSCRCVVLNAH